MSDGLSVFAKYVEDGDPKKESPTEPEIVRRGPRALLPPAQRNSASSEKLLTWLVNCWPKNIITLRDISAYGPNCVRDPKDVMNLTQTLTEYGWLEPIQAWRRDQKKWRVVRGPSKSTQT